MSQTKPDVSNAIQQSSSCAQSIKERILNFTAKTALSIVTHKGYEYMYMYVLKDKTEGIVDNLQQLMFVVAVKDVEF